MDPGPLSPDHTTLSRRAQQLEVQLPAVGRGTTIQLFVDSSDLQIVGQGPWAAAGHGDKGTREWRKLHIRVDQNGVIVAEKLTDSSTDDASVVPDLVAQVPDDKKITRFTDDVAYDQNSIFEMLVEPGVTVVVPIAKTATLSRKRTRVARARNRTVNQLQKVGRSKWKKESRYHRQARAENTFFRYKHLLGGRLRSRNRGNHESESRLACNILNRMLGLGAPRSQPIRE